LHKYLDFMGGKIKRIRLTLYSPATRLTRFVQFSLTKNPMKSKPVKKSGYWGYKKATDLVTPVGPGETKHEELVFPQPVILGGYNFHVKYMSSEMAEKEQQWGCCDFNTQTVWLSETLTGIHFAVILLHELFHACHYVLGLDDSSSEESFTHGQANAVVMFMRFNPEVWDWINAYIREVQLAQEQPVARPAPSGRRAIASSTSRRGANVIKIA
jgi:hypothetical protein